MSIVYCKDCVYRKETNLPNDAYYCERLNMHTGLLGCENGIAKVKTNADRIRSMTDEELAEWYWWMLRYVQGYTDSKLALSEWLKEEVSE